VVIASATINPAPFQSFFGLEDEALSVPGRVFPITLEHVPPPEDLDEKDLIAEHVVPTVLDALRTHAEGHCLVFLPGAFTSRNGDLGSVPAP
jgi:HrpA-like RNA helicase